PYRGKWCSRPMIVVCFEDVTWIGGIVRPRKGFDDSLPRGPNALRSHLFGFDDDSCALRKLYRPHGTKDALLEYCLDYAHGYSLGGLALIRLFQYCITRFAEPIPHVRHSSDSTAMRMARPLATCSRMADCGPSATSGVISTPRLMGPGARSSR